jgi:hypothetical protein
LDSDWAATNHKVTRGAKLVKYTMLDVYIHLKAAHDSSGSLDRFPTENQVKSYISSARKATRERNDPTASAILRQVAAGPKAGGGGRAKRKSKNPNPNQLKPKKRAPPKKKKSLAKRGGGDGSSSEDSLDDSNPDDEAEVPEDEPSTYVGMEVRKYFDGVGECRGAVVGHDIDEDTGLILFIVEYDDKEQEDYNWSELRPLLLCDNSTSPKPGSDRDSDSENDGLPITPLGDNSTSQKPGSDRDSDSENDDLPISALLGSSSAK